MRIYLFRIINKFFILFDHYSIQTLSTKGMSAHILIDSGDNPLVDDGDLNVSAAEASYSIPEKSLVNTAELISQIVLEFYHKKNYLKAID